MVSWGSSRAQRHKASADEYERQGGSPAVRAAGDRTAQQIAHQREVDEATRAELNRDR